MKHKVFTVNALALLFRAEPKNNNAPQTISRVKETLLALLFFC